MINEEIKQKIIEDYQNGVPLKEIQYETKISRQSIYRIRVKAGVEQKTKHWEVLESIKIDEDREFLSSGEIHISKSNLPIDHFDNEIRKMINLPIKTIANRIKMSPKFVASRIEYLQENDLLK